MRVRSNTIMEYGTYMLMYLASYVSSLAGLPVLSGILMLTVGLSLLSIMLPLIGMMNSIG